MRWRALASVLAVGLAGSSVARADDAGARIVAYEAEVKQLTTDLLRIEIAFKDAPTRQLADGIVDFQMGNYDKAALTLLDLAGSLTGPDKDTATYYLAETLYRKGDLGGSHTYFTELTAGKNIGSKYYQPALVRLVEIAIALHEPAEQPLGLLDQLSPTQRLPSVNYVKAKYAFAEAKYDEVLAHLTEVPKGSDLDLQVQYYTGTVHVAKQDYPRATEVFNDSVLRKPKTPGDWRVIELAELALGRLYYEGEQFSKSVDSYLMIDRHSDLFRDALYEVSWVYVKNKQYDKALRSLELLTKSDTATLKTPTVRLLEGNLHIRKAQMLRAALINGTIGTEKTEPSSEYTKAAVVFDDAHTQYQPSYDMLTQLIDASIDAGQYLNQISNRKGDVFQTSVPMPEAAATLLREEPEVQRIAQVDSDLGEIQAHLDRTQNAIERIEARLAVNDRTTLYPVLNQKRSRLIKIEEELIKIRNDLADQQEKLVTPSGDLPQLEEARRRLAQQYTALGDPEQAYVDRRRNEREAYDKLEKGAGEVDSAINATQAMSVAVHKYATTPDAKLTPEQRSTAIQKLDGEGKEAKSIEGELGAIHKEIDLGRDLAGVGDQQIASARQLRQQLMVAQDVELRSLAGFASASSDSGRSQSLAATAERASRVIDQLRASEAAIDRKIDQSVETARQEMVTEKAQLSAYRNELTELDAEARNLGAVVLMGAFRDVKAKLNDIVIRADVGTIDTLWSQKADTDDDLKRLNLSRARELKQLKDEFRDILEANQPKKKTAAPVSDLPAANTAVPASSPDKGGPQTRVNSAGGTTTQQPTVKPDDTKRNFVDPKKDPKKGGGR